MSEVEREAEDLAETFAIPYEETVLRIEEERDLESLRENEAGSVWGPPGEVR